MSVPPLAEWLRWVAERPPVLDAAPEGFPDGRVRVRAVVADLHEALFQTPAEESLLGVCAAGQPTRAERSRLGWILAASQVLWHPAIRRAAPKRDRFVKLIVQELPALAALVPPDRLGEDEERREELVRRVLRATQLSLPGERATDAEDRLRQVDSVERHRVIAAAAERERRAREVREAMARKAAEEAAAKVSRE
jgi:hypothetical protein